MLLDGAQLVASPQPPALAPSTPTRTQAFSLWNKYDTHLPAWNHGNLTLQFHNAADSRTFGLRRGDGRPTTADAAARDFAATAQYALELHLVRLVRQLLTQPRVGAIDGHTSKGLE